MKRVLITHALPDSLLEPLRGLADVIVGPDGGDLMPREEVLRHGPALHCIVNQAELKIDEELLDRCPQLRLVVNVSVGIDNLNLGLLTSRRIWAANTPDCFVAATADFALGLMLCLARPILKADAFVRAGRWQSFQPGVWDGDLLAGRCLGLIGYGRIGRAVASRARAFGMRVIHTRFHASSDPEYRPLDELLAQSDYISSHLPLTPATTGLLDRTRFQKMRMGARFINLGRGKTVVEGDLAEALASGHLAGAALDVFENEPLVHPGLMSLSNVILAPHIGGGTRQGRLEARRLAVENVVRVLGGRPPVAPLNRF